MFGGNWVFWINLDGVLRLLLDLLIGVIMINIVKIFNFGRGNFVG